MHERKQSMSQLIKDTDPLAVMEMENGSRVVIELLPDAAPNTVASFVWAASRGYLDHHVIERIVPGSWVDMSYTAFGHRECRFLIPYESKLHPEIEPLDSHPGCVCMGGYGEAGLASCEFFFPLRDCPEHKGIYPVFGKVAEGMEEIERIGKVPVRRMKPLAPGVELYVPEEPQIVRSITLDLKGWKFPDPVRMKEQKLPKTWR